MTEAFHIHCDSRRSANAVFHISLAQCEEALARAPALAGRVRFTTGWDLEGSEAVLQTAGAWVGFHLPKAAVQTAPGLRTIHLIGSGAEHLRPLDWFPRHVQLTNNRGIHRQKAAEFILMALLMLNNRIPVLFGAQRQRRWAPIFTGQAKGKTVLVVGAGALGSAGAEAARTLGFTTIGIRRRGGPPDAAFDEMHTPDALHSLLPRADFVLVTTPSTAATDGLIGAREFDLMRPTAGFINFGRARVCDYAALAERLRDGRLPCAILDVFDPEPLPESSPLWDVPNLLITPHCSSDDAERYIPATLDLVLDNIQRLLAGTALRNRVDPGLEY